MNLRFIFAAFLCTIVPTLAMDLNNPANQNCCCIAVSVMWRYVETEAVLTLDKSVRLLGNVSNFIAPEVKQKKD